MVHPLTGEVLPKEITSLIKARRELKEIEVNVRKSLEEIDGIAMELMENEYDGQISVDGRRIKVQRSSRKVFDVDQVVELLGGKTHYIDEEEKRVEFYSPQSGAIQDYLKERLNRDELSQEEADLYNGSYYDKPTAPFLKEVK